jgi:hypothetical protein
MAAVLDPDAERRVGLAQTRPAYAGTGSRETPCDVLELIESIAARLARQGWTLRTGMSPGADQAFYRGARDGCGGVELYLPWPDFEAGARLGGDGEEVHVLPRPSEDAYELAARFHPSWEGLSAGARHLLARDGHQVLGADLATPVKFVVCWTPDGSLDGTGPRAGGTGQALRIAHHDGIGVLNLARPDHACRAARR